jgi:hypothetical protein
MYLKIKNEKIEKYPYTVYELKTDNPDTSFPKDIPEHTLAEWGVLPVKPVERPEADHTKNVKEDAPQFINGEWVQVWEVTPASGDELLQRILELRAEAYPPMSDYLDGVVKGDQAQIDKYIADCLAVKAKYPKPTV